MKFTLTFLYIFISAIIFGQALSTYPSLPMTDFYEVSISGKNIVALGSCNQIWVSKNEGVDWEYSETENRLVALQFHPTDNNLVFYRNEDALELFNIKTGEKMDVANDPNFGSTSDIKFIGDNMYVLLVNQIMHSKVGVYDWSPILTDINTNDDRPKSFDVTSSFICYGTNGGDLYKVDRNTFVKTKMLNVSNKINELDMINDVDGIFTDGIVVYRTSDGWENFESLENFNIARNIYMISRDTIISILGTTLSLTTDGGKTRDYRKMSHTAVFGDISNGLVLPNNKICAFGAGSTIAFTEDFGESWTFPNTYKRTNFYDVEITENGMAYVCGEHGNMLVSNDEGKTWEDFQHSFGEEELLNRVSALNSGKLVIASSEGIYQYVNGTISNSLKVSANALYYDREKDFLLAHIYNNSRYEIIKSTDEGLTWEVVLEDIGFLKHITKGSNGKLYFSNNSTPSVIYSSVDDGATWQEQLVDQGVWQVHELDGRIITVANYDVRMSDDGGATWDKIAGYYGADNFHFITKEEFYMTYATGFETHLVHTTDSGANWEEIYNNCAMTLDMVITPSGNLLMAQEAGHINLFEQIQSNNKDQKQLSERVVAYPNPLAVRSSLKLSAVVDEVQVFDIHGVMVYKGSDISKVDGRFFDHSGMYLLKLSTKDGIQTTKIFVY